MCGICGVYVNNGDSVGLRHIEKLNQTLKHRGPDDEGYLVETKSGCCSLAGKDTPQEVIHSSYCYSPSSYISTYPKEAHLLFGHRRLSIIDTSAKGHQPMCDKNQEVWIVYNGEVYNYIELREELEGHGFLFKTGSDTEVIINAYLHWGKSCVDHFNGMWAFVIYDKNNQILFGSRDRLGVKPLYYFKNENHFVFASEQKALAKCELVQTGINDRAVFDYLVLSHSQPETEGFFRNIIELKPGHNFELGLNDFRLRINQFYSPSEIVESPIVGLGKELPQKLHDLIEKAITIRTRSDVELGSCLSGGIDSSYIAIVLHDFFKTQSVTYNPKAFTAAFAGYKYDEEKWAEKVIDQTNFDWVITRPKAEDLLHDLSSMLYAADTPMLTTSTYAQYRVMKLAGENKIKVLLDGQGADELFAGYSQFSHVYYNELFSRFRLFSLLEELKSHNSFMQNLKGWVRADLRNLVQAAPMGLSRFFYEQSVFELRYVKTELKNSFKERFAEIAFPFGANLNSVLKQYSGGEKLQTMLRLEDRMSMNFSVESRTPFADDVHLIEFALSLPSKYKIRNGVHKAILRQAGQNTLPTEILSRKDKIGFQTPEFDWLKELKDQIPDLLENNISEFVNKDMLKTDLKKLIDSPTSLMSSRLLRFILLSQWRKIYQI